MKDKINFSIENKKIEKYTKTLLEKYRPPSRKGNTGALHMHILTIDGIKYSFKALGYKQWVFKSDKISFNYVDNNGYRNILIDSIKTIDKNGNIVIRGNRETKQKTRTILPHDEIVRYSMIKTSLFPRKKLSCKFHYIYVWCFPIYYCKHSG